jgi:tetratricopeptide (TPR) repeat protein
MKGDLVNPLLPRWAARIVVIGVLLLSVALVGYGAWLLQLERGARAADRGDVDAAANIYASAERPFTRISALAWLLPDQYSRSVFPQVALLYRRGKTKDATAKLEQAGVAAPALSERAEFAFWSGNVLLRQAMDEEDPDLIMKNLYAAGEHYRKALATVPDDWDLKYNYELVQYLIAQQENENKKEESKVKSLLERMRTVTEPGEKEPPPPEKRG